MSGPVDLHVMLNEMQSMSRETTALEVFVELKRSIIMEPSVAGIIKRANGTLNCVRKVVRGPLSLTETDSMNFTIKF
jgi:hypothetical protein